MTRAEALAVARSAKSGKRERGLKVRREIDTLKLQVSDAARSKFSSGLNINVGNIDEEYVPELKTLKGRVAILERMANDPLVRAQLRSIVMTIISGVRWKVVGGTSEQRDLIAANLLRQGPRKFWCDTSWYDRLIELCGCLIYGFALFGKTRRLVDGKVIFSSLTWLHPRSVDEDGWEMDGSDRLLGVRRTYLDGAGGMHARELTPSSELFIACWDRRGPNWEGNAFIRPLYKPWKIAELAEKIDIIDLQNRGVGIPMAKLSGAGSVKERDALKQILQDMRGGSKERAFVVIDKDSEVKFLTSEGQARPAADLLDRQRANIYSAGGTEFMNSNNAASGSRAAGSVMASGFYVNVDAIRILLEDMVNYGCGPMPGLVEELRDLNSDDEEDEDDDPVRIEGSRISPTEQLDNIPTIGDLIQKGALTKTVDLENSLRNRLTLPEIDEAEFEEKNQAPPTSIGGRPDGASSSTDPPDPREDDMGNRFGMRAEKKTPDDGSQPLKKPPSWPWVESNRS